MQLLLIPLAVLTLVLLTLHGAASSPAPEKQSLASSVQQTQP